MKKTLSILLATLLLLTMLPLSAISVSAKTYGDLTYEISNGKVTITDCKTSASGELIIPSTIDGYPVTSIGYSAFSYCDSLTSVTIPDSVTSIGDYAFQGCTSLTSVTIPNSVTSIDYLAFGGCTSLTSVTIPDSVTSIEYLAFGGCTSLTSVTIPDSVARIGDGAFSGCTGLNGFVVHPDNRYFFSVDGVLFNRDITELIQYPGCKDGGYNIPDSVTRIRGGAFGGCTSLTSVTIPNSVTSIDYLAFSDCTSLTSVTIPDSVTSIDYLAFSACTSLTSVTIPDSVTSIGDEAFYRCAKLVDVWYTGSKADRAAISIGEDNTKLIDATWHYNVQIVGDHIYDNVCDTTCNICSATRTVKHNYKAATCTAPKTCKICGVTSGSVLSHTYKDATCTALKTCKTCGATTGKALGHKYTNACDKTCNRSGCDYKRTVNPHVYSDEWCDADCNICGATRKAPHRYFDACDIDCNLCGKVRKVTHTYDNACDEYCNICDDYREIVGHKYTNSCDRDCNECGYRRTITHKYSNKCDSTCNVCGSKRKVAAHNYKTAVGKAATLTANGYTIKTCTECKKTTGDKTVIRKVGHVKLSATSYTYDGKVKKPTITIKDSYGNKISSSYYTVTYASGRKNVGTYSVKITFKGRYSGTKTLTFKILPTKTSISSLTAGTKKLTVKWAKKTTQVTGYEVQYSTSKTFASSVKTKTITKNSTVSTTLTGLSAKKTYYVRVRTYKVVNGKKVYSAWSTVKSAKTK